MIGRFRRDPTQEELKLFLTGALLRFRRNMPQLFSGGSYLPLRAGGSNSSHVLAFYREHREESMIVAVSKLPATLMKGQQNWPLGDEVWKDTSLEMPRSGDYSYRDILTGGHHAFSQKIKVADLFEHLPVSVLKNSK